MRVLLSSVALPVPIAALGMIGTRNILTRRALNQELRSDDAVTRSLAEAASVFDEMSSAHSDLTGTLRESGINTEENSDDDSPTSFMEMGLGSLATDGTEADFSDIERRLDAMAEPADDKAEKSEKTEKSAKKASKKEEHDDKKLSEKDLDEMDKAESEAVKDVESAAKKDKKKADKETKADKKKSDEVAMMEE
jgi:hypothetical protein